MSERVRIEDSVVMPEAWIGSGCRLKRVIVGPGVEVPAGFEAEDAVLCPDPGGEADLPAAARRVDGLLVCTFETSPLPN